MDDWGWFKKGVEISDFNFAILHFQNKTKKRALFGRILIFDFFEFFKCKSVDWSKNQLKIIKIAVRTSFSLSGVVLWWTVVDGGRWWAVEVVVSI